MNFDLLKTAVVAAALVSTVMADPLTLNSLGVVGTVNGLAGDNPGTDELGFAQHLLDMTAGTVDDFGSPLHHYATSNTEYSGTLTGPTLIGAGDHPYSVSAGWEYAIAKYDGKNAGYVLFYLGGSAMDLPQYSYSIWGTNAEQFQISGFTAFNQKVPDGGTTVMLLGLGVIGLALAIWRFKSA